MGPGARSIGDVIAAIWPKVIFVSFLLAGQVCSADEILFEGFDKELSGRYGYLLVDTHTERTVSEWLLAGRNEITVKPPVGRRMLLLALRPGDYAWKQLSVPHFNLPYQMDLEDRRWRFKIERGVINYAGTLLVGEQRGRRSIDVRMLNRSAEVWEILQTHKPEFLEMFELKYSGSQLDHFMSDVLSKQNSPL